MLPKKCPFCGHPVDQNKNDGGKQVVDEKK